MDSAPSASANEPGDIGVAMVVSSVAAAIFQSPAGLLVDNRNAKRLLWGACSLRFTRSSPPVIFMQIIIGGASAIIPLAQAALASSWSAASGSTHAR